MKDKILDFLKQNNDYMSGEQISNKIGVTRAAVWKGIKKLQEEGYVIDSRTKVGYKLIEEPDIVTKSALMPILKENKLVKEIHYKDELDSTNQFAKELAREGASEGTIVIADSQTSGKGRLGRTWISPPKTGIWLSLILRPKIKPQYAGELTLLSGLCMCEAIHNITGLQTHIKWPNDVVVNGKKVCGILTEMSAEIEMVNHVVIGVGVNVNQKNFEEELPYATSLNIEGKTTYRRSMIVKEFMDIFEIAYEKYKESESLVEFLPRYENKCITLGKEVKIIEGGKEIIAKAVRVVENGNLIVLLPDGQEKQVYAGEVSVRGLFGYI